MEYPTVILWGQTQWHANVSFRASRRALSMTFLRSESGRSRHWVVEKYLARWDISNVLPKVSAFCHLEDCRIQSSKSEQSSVRNMTGWVVFAFWVTTVMWLWEASKVYTYSKSSFMHEKVHLYTLIFPAWLPVYTPWSIWVELIHTLEETIEHHWTTPELLRIWEISRNRRHKAGECW